VTNPEGTVVPVWTLVTDAVSFLPNVMSGEAMTPGRLTELRSVLAALADAPIATLEAYPLPTDVDRTRGIALDAVSPLAQELSQLIARTTSAAPGLSASGEALYRMVVPAKVASQFGKGLVRSMASTGPGGGIHSALVNSSGIAAQASFVPVSGTASKAAGAVGAVGAAGALTVAAPLVLMAVAAGVSGYADYQQRQATEHIIELLEKLHEHRLQDERNALNGCRDAIDAAPLFYSTAVKLATPWDSARPCTRSTKRWQAPKNASTAGKKPSPSSVTVPSRSPN
jgi:hypothetical protein